MYFSLRVSPNHNPAKKRLLLGCLCYCWVGRTWNLKCPAILLRSPPKPVTCRPMSSSRLQWHKSVTYWKVSAAKTAARWKYVDTYLLVSTRYQIKATLFPQVFPTVCNNSLNLSFSLQTCGGWQLNRLREASYVIHRNKQTTHGASMSEAEPLSLAESVFLLQNIWNVTARVSHNPPQMCHWNQC